MFPSSLRRRATAGQICRKGAVISGKCYKPGIRDSDAICTGKTCVYADLASRDGVGGWDPQRGVEEASKAIVEGAQVACDGGGQTRTGHNLRNRQHTACQHQLKMHRMTSSSRASVHGIVTEWHPAGSSIDSGSDSCRRFIKAPMQCASRCHASHMCRRSRTGSGEVISMSTKP